LRHDLKILDREFSVKLGYFHNFGSYKMSAALLTGI
jgi:hypothetical protein